MDNNDNNYYQDPQQQPSNNQPQQPSSGQPQQQSYYNQQQQQQSYYQPQQQQPYYQSNQTQYGTENEPPMTLGDWVITLLLLAIPCVNIIMIFVWGFGSGTNTSKKNYARAVLIFMIIGVVFSLLLSTVLVGMLRSIFNSFYGFY